MPLSCILLLAAAPLAALAGPLPADELGHAAADERILKEAKIGTDGPALLDYLRKRTMTAEKRTRIAGLIRKLGSDEFEERETASNALLDMGPAAIPALRTAAQDNDRERRRRAERILETLERRLEAGHVAAVTRLLGARKPAGSVQTLLGYLPDAYDEREAEEVRSALLAAGVTKGKPDPLLVAALADPDPSRRGAAAEVVARCGAADHAPAVRKLLVDKEPSVRLRAAVGLAHAKQKEAVPVLIDLLAVLPAERRGPAEEVLYRLADENPPETSFGEDEAARRKVKEAWTTWWAKNRDKADLGRLGRDSSLGYTTVILFGAGSVRLVEFGRDNKVLWNIKGLENGVDFRVLPGNRVLIAEHGSNRVTERTFDNKILWEVKLNTLPGHGGGAILCQRLASGNTFIVTPNGYAEVDRGGKLVSGKNGLSLRAAYKYRDGRIATVDSRGTFHRYDPAGKLEVSFPTTLNIGNTLGGIDFLPDGGLLVSRNDKVVQKDSAGKNVWEVAVDRPYCPTRLNNGNTLVACTATNEIFEFDRTGKKVKTLKVDSTPWLARRR